MMKVCFVSKGQPPLVWVGVWLQVFKTRIIQEILTCSQEWGWQFICRSKSLLTSNLVPATRHVPQGEEPRNHPTPSPISQIRLKSRGLQGPDLKPWVPHWLSSLKKKFFLFIYGCAGFFLLPWLFSSCIEWELLSSCSVQASHCGGFSCFRAQVLGPMGFSSCGCRAVGHRRNSCGTWV